MFERLIQWIKGVLRMFEKATIKQALGVNPAISGPMQEAISLWMRMYQNDAPWLNKDIHSLNLPAAIAGEIARATTIEMNVEITGSPRAKYLATQLAPALSKLREQTEKGVAGGGLMMKPYIQNGKIAVDFIQSDQFVPVSFDANGNITACVFADQRQVGDKFYTRLEYHQMGNYVDIEGNPASGCLIRNLAFKSSTPDDLGRPVALTEVPEWAELQDNHIIKDIDKPLFAYFRYPLANNIDPTSPLGVSCYSRATSLIEQADRAWSDLLWELESGQRALYADVVAFQKKADGTPVLPMKRLYRWLGGSSNIGENPEGLFHDWSPTLREQNYLNALDAILRRIEFVAGLAYGTLSNPQSVDKTATELKISQQRSYATVTDTQKALENALNDLLYAMDVWIALGNLAPKGTYAAVFTFDDSVIVDKDAQFQQDARLVGMGIMSKVEFRVRNFGEDEATAKAKIAQATAEQPQEADLFQRE